MVGAVGIELKATLKIRKLFILLNGQDAKNSGFAQPRYTQSTRRLQNERSLGFQLTMKKEVWSPVSTMFRLVDKRVSASAVA